MPTNTHEEDKPYDQLVREFVDSIGGELSFQDLGTIVKRAKRIVEADGDAVNTRDKIIAVVECIVDQTDTPWLDDKMTDPFMKAMVPSLVDYLLQLCTATSPPVSFEDEGCFWSKLGLSGKIFRC